MDRVERVVENKEGEQQEEKAEKNRETNRGSVNELQQEPGVDSKKKKRRKKDLVHREKKLKNTLKCRWCTCVRHKLENYTLKISLKVILSYIFA